MALDDPPCPPALVAVDGPLWVIDKPAGYVVHPVGNPDHPDILAWAVAEYGAPACLAPIHRLDRLTSGVVLCSPDAALRGELGAAFAERRIAKIYLAL
ncbi:MAG: pseudouridine synthase, partial [Proteobacteria bacterium]